MRLRKKPLSVLLSAALLLTLAMPAYAETPAVSTGKEEVIYVNLQADGTVAGVYAVNIFGKGPVTDYGAYSDVKMLNTNDEITQNGDTVTFDASADRTYYEGKLQSNQIPWNISLTYSLDGNPCGPEELAGKSGSLEIRFAVTENPACPGTFFDDYALQASFTLDTEKCSNITAPDATVANVGGNKQLSYTMLPGKGIDTTITAEVRDFEMPAVSVNGIPLSMDVEVDDEALMDQVSDLLEAIAELDNGAGALRDGTSSLKNQAGSSLQSGASELAQGASDLQKGAAGLQDSGAQLNDGSKSLQEGAQTLYSGVEALNDGILLTQDSLTALNAQSAALTDGSAGVKAALLEMQSSLDGASASAADLTELVQASAEIKGALEGLSGALAQLQGSASFSAYKAAMQANGLDIDALQSGNSAMAAALSEQIAALSAAGEDTAQLQSIVSLLQSSNAAIYGVDTYLTQLNGSIGELAASAAALSEKYAVFDESVNGLAQAMGDTPAQMSALRDGINALAQQYEDLDAGLKDYTNGVAQITAGYSEVTTGSAGVLAGSRNLRDGTAAMYDKTGELLSGISDFYDATGSLKDGTGKLDSGVAELLVGIANLYDGSSELKSGTGELRSETAGMDTDISEKIDEMLKSITGENTEITSFVSEKNTDVKSVQFIIQTEAIKIPGQNDTTAEVEETTTFWEKLQQLFD